MNKWMLVLLLFLFPLNLSAFPYLCIMESSVGYSKNENTKKWERQRFTAGEKYLLKKSVLKSNIAVLNKFGEEYSVSMCGEIELVREKKITDLEKEILKQNKKKRGVLDCEGILNAKINVKTLEIIMYGYGGYAYGDEANTDSPYLSIGSCTPL